ncbi:hypothetical protein [Flavobacterium phycosphaerae]|uniref:hypothetical protein n=1 Tax=Flavobacterium phycosphaerae TaxID=2697515 RepID=UPI0013898647|nr:hypothetical protein [Flavobacterium phycosphaerae]
MAAGGPGDHPLTDIVNFNLKVYNSECDELVREISKLVSRHELYEMFDWFDNFSATEIQLEKFKIELKDKLEKLKEKAKSNGWEV